MFGLKTTRRDKKDDADQAQPRSGASWKAQLRARMRGQRFAEQTRRTKPSPADWELAQLKESHEEQAVTDPMGGTLSSTTETYGQTFDSVDREATVAANRARLRQGLVPMQVELSDKRAEAALARSNGALETAERLEQEVAALESELTRQDAAIDEAGFDQLSAIAAKLGVPAESLVPVSTPKDGSTQTLTDTTQLADGQLSRERTLTDTTYGGGVANTTTRSGAVRAGALDGGGLGLEASSAESQSSEDIATGIKDTTTETGSVSGGFMDGGLGLAGSLESEQVVGDGTKDADGKSDDYEASSSVDGKVVLTDDAIAATIGTKEESTGGRTSASSLNGKLEEDAITLGGAHSESVTDGDGMTHSFGVGGQGTIRMDVVRVPGTEPPAYDSVFVLSVGGELSAGTKAGGEKASIGATVKGSASATVTHRKRLSDSELDRYRIDLAEWEQTGQAPAGLGELAPLMRGCMVGDRARDADGALAVLGGSGAAAELEDAESVELTTKLGGAVGGKGSLKGGGLGLNVSAEAGKEWVRQVKVAGGPNDQVLVTVSVVDSASLEGSLGLSMGISATIARSCKEGHGESATFTLSPTATRYSYGAIYDEILSVTGRDALQRLAASARYAELGITTERTTTGSAEETQSVAFGLNGGTVGDQRISRLDTAVTHRGDELEAVLHGGNEYRLGAGTDDMPILQHTDREDGTLELDAAGDLTGTFEEVKTNTVPGLTSSLDIRTLLTRSYPRFATLKLDAAGMELLIDRAGGDPNLWAVCCPYGVHTKRRGVTTRAAWERLQGQLNNPTLDPEAVATNPESAVKLAQGLAIAEFMQWPDSMEAVVSCAQSYGRDTTTGITSSAKAGTQAEWPSSISGDRAAYRAAEGAVTSLTGELDSDRGDAANGQARGLARCRDLTDELLRLHRLLENNAASFDSPAVALEMVSRLDGYLRTVRKARYQFVSSWPMAADSSVIILEPTEDGMARVQQLEAEARRFKTQEQAIFATMHNELDSAHRDDGLVSKGVRLFLAPMHNGAGVVQEAQDQIRALYRDWRSCVLALRAAYGDAGIEDGWLVSHGPKDPRAEDAEPDASYYKALVDAYSRQEGWDVAVSSSWMTRNSEY